MYVLQYNMDRKDAFCHDPFSSLSYRVSYYVIVLCILMTDDSNHDAPKSAIRKAFEFIWVFLRIAAFLVLAYYMHMLTDSIWFRHRLHQPQNAGPVDFGND